MAAVSESTSSSIFALLSDRISTLARARDGMALTLAPPSMKPTLMLDFGKPLDLELPDLVESFKRTSENWEIARLNACTGLPTPKSLQLCPPGPLKITSKRRLPSARFV